jgi:hypothetical protein
MSQTRSYARGTPIGSGTIRHTGQSLGKKFQIIDISANGVAIFSADGFEEGDQVSVKLEITDILFEKTINFEGRVLKKTKSNAGCTYAIKITKMNQDDRVEIDEMISCLNAINQNLSSGLLESSDSDLGVNWLSNLNDSKDDS